MGLAIRQPGKSKREQLLCGTELGELSYFRRDGEREKG